MQLQGIAVATVLCAAGTGGISCFAQARKPVLAFESPKPCSGPKVFVTVTQTMYEGPDTFSKNLGSYVAGQEFPCVQVGTSIGRDYARVKLPEGSDGYLDMLWLSYKDNRTFFKTADGVEGYLVGTSAGGGGDAQLDLIVLPVQLAGGSKGTNEVKIRDIQTIEVDPEKGKVTITKTSGQTIVGTTEPEEHSLRYVTTYSRETAFISKDGSRFPFSQFKGRLVRVGDSTKR